MSRANFMCGRGQRSGQQMLEHLLVMSSVVVVVVFFMARGGYFNGVVNSILYSPGSMIENNTKGDLVF